MGDSAEGTPTGNDAQTPETTTSAGATKNSSETLKPGDVITEQFLVRLAKLEKYEHKLAEVARVYRNLNMARKSIEVVLKKHTPIQSIGEVEELEAHLSNLNMKTQYAGEQIGALTELDKTNRNKIQELELQLKDLKLVDEQKVKELETLSKERKVVEGQLDRANQKLKLDIENLKSEYEDLDAKNKELEAKAQELAQENESLKESKVEPITDPDALADQLSSMITGDAPGQQQQRQQEDWPQMKNLVSLGSLIIEKCGTPKGFVDISEHETLKSDRAEVGKQLDEAKKNQEFFEQEVAKVKESLHKELEASEQRTQAITGTKDKELAELRQQLKTQEEANSQSQMAIEAAEHKVKQWSADHATLQTEIESLRSKLTDAEAKLDSKSKPTVAAAAAHADGASGLTAERVGDIINAAIASRLVPSSSNDSSTKPATEPQQQPQQQQGGGGNKKKGKKKRKATTTVGGGQGNDSVPTTPTTPTTHSSPLSDTPVEVTKDEVDRLVVLIESVAGTKQVASGTERTQADDVAIKELNGQIEKLRSEVDELKTKLSESEKASEATSKDFTEQIEKLKAEASQLETTLKAVEEERDKLKKDLDAKEQEMALAVSELEKKLAESDTAKNEQSARSEELDKALKDSRTSLLTLSKKHASDMDAQNQKLEEATSELAGLKKQVKEVSVLQERSEKAKASAAKLEKELRDCQSKLTSLETELTTSQKECADLKKSAGSFKEERSKLASTLAKAQGASARLENKQQELQVQLAKLTTEREKEKQRADAAEKSLKSVNEEHAKARESIEAGSKTIADKERQLADTQAKLAELEEHVRTIDVDLANSRELFSEKSRLLAQTTAQLQEMQYSLEKEKRAAKVAAEDAAKEIQGAKDQLAEAQKAAREKSASDHAEMEKLRGQLSDSNQRASQAIQVERLEAQQAEREAELETLRSNLRRAEETQASLQVEVDRLRDVERDLSSAKEQLGRVVDERKLSEQRWKRVHRDLKEEVRRLHRERQMMLASSSQSPAAAGAGGGPSTASSPIPPTSPQRQGQAPALQNLQSPQGSGPSISSPSSRSNSLTMASVSALLRAATGNAAASGGIAAGRRASTQSVTTSPTTFTSSQSGTRASRMHPQMSHNGSVEEEPGSADLVSPTDIDTAGGRPKIHRPKSIDTNGLHTRSSSRSGSISEGFSGDDTRGDSSSVNVEYLRNVLFRFFNDKERRSQLVPVLSTLLNCNAEEIKHIQSLLA